MDAVTLAVVRGALEQIADEMDLHLIRAALSPIISETNDCAHGIFDAVTGETIAQGSYGLPMFIANMQLTVQKMIPVAGEFKPGDLWMLNDPYLSGTHLNDVVLVSPYFVDGKLFALLANTGHWMDMGGSTPGGWAPTAQEIHQEGLVIPPIKLYDAGVRNDAVVNLITANVRMPQQALGDLEAMINVFNVSRRRLDELVRRYGVGKLTDCIQEMMKRSEAEMRSYIEEIPDGTYRVSDWLDNDGIEDVPLPVTLTMTVSGSDLHLDFTGTSKATRGPMNISDNTTKSMCLVALKHLFPEVPVNGGAFRPVRITIPPGCMLAAAYPSAVGGTTEVTLRVVDVVLAALSQAIPDATPATTFGTTGVCTVSGRNPDSGSYFVAVFPYPGGYGASRVSDGLVNGPPVGSRAKFMSIEMSEHRYPVRFAYHGMREGSGGAGLHRGGCGTQYGIEMRSDVVVSILGDRVDHSPAGACGGGPAAPNVVRLTTNGKSWIPPMRSKAEKVLLHADDSVQLASPGGGGFGSPLDRDPALVQADLDDGVIEIDTAERTYGVVIGGTRKVADRTFYTLDSAATERRRHALRAASTKTEATAGR